MALSVGVCLALALLAGVLPARAALRRPGDPVAGWPGGRVAD